jgi:hypothetical protein
LFSCLPSFGQYKKLIDENKLWVINCSYYNHGDFNYYEGEFFYYEYFKGDTIIQNSTYKKLYHQKFYDHHNDFYYPPATTDTTLQPPDLVGLVREDTITQKVYFIDLLMNMLPAEELLFDFKLTLGDTMSTPCYSPYSFPTNNPIDSIGEVVLFNNDTCQISYFDYNQTVIMSGITSNFMIEGVGGPGGVYMPFDMTPITQDLNRTLVCYKENSVNLFGPCDQPKYYTSINELTKKIDLSFYPNPSTGYFSASEPLKKSATITILNYLGEQVQTLKFNANERVEFNIEGAAGIYLIQIKTPNATITNKVLKQ